MKETDGRDKRKYKEVVWKKKSECGKSGKF